MNIIIIGKRSFLSKEIKKIIPKSKVVSTKKILDRVNSKKYLKDNTTFVINSFYPLFKILNNKTDNISLINDSVIFLIKFLKLIRNIKNIKILYSSTCAVKNFSINLSNTRSVYTSTKIISEQILREHQHKKKIQLIIIRLFNLYGGLDKASIINKIIKASNKSPLKINNNGRSKRDFIHVNDVSQIYKKLIFSNFSGSLDVGSGKSIAIKSLINLNSNKFIINKKKIRESKNSKANTKILSKYYDLKKLKNVKNFINQKLRAK